MESLRDLSLLRRPLLLVVTSLVFSGVLGSSSRPALCDVSCCSVLPSCDNARVVTCDCFKMDTIVFRKGDIPVTVRAVDILNTRHVTIDKHAINHLQHLTSITISGIDMLEIKQDGMAVQPDSELLSVIMRDIESLQVESKSFSGVWNPKTSIRFHRINNLDIKSNAFNYQVVESRPNVSVQHVAMLNLERKGFSADVFELNLYNVTMNVCHDESFGGNIFNNELNNVTIYEATGKCFHSLNDFTTFNLQSLKIQNAQPQAFSGNMRELLINNSHFSTVHEHSFNISVTSMELTNSYIGELRSNGLTINASDTLRIDTVRVEYLRKHALFGLQMKPNKDEFPEPVVIHKLKLINADNGSLTFSECTKVSLTDLNLVTPWPRICPTEKRAQALSGGGVRGQLTPAQYQLYFQLKKESARKSICPEDDAMYFPIKVDNPICFARVKGDPSNQPDSDGDDGEGNALSKNTLSAPATVELHTSPLPALPPATTSPDNFSSTQMFTDTPTATAGPTPAYDNTLSVTDEPTPAPDDTLLVTNGPSTAPDDTLTVTAGPTPTSNDTLSVTDGPTPASSGVQQIDQDQLLLYLGLGGGIMLVVVLTVRMLRNILKRSRSGKSTSTSGCSSGLTGLNGPEVRTGLTAASSDGPEVRTGLTAACGCSSGLTGLNGPEVRTGLTAASSVDEHLYEPIREELLLQPLQPTTSDVLSPKLVDLQEHSHPTDTGYQYENGDLQEHSHPTDTGHQYENGGSRQVDSLYSSQRQSVDDHVYETIEESRQMWPPQATQSGHPLSFRPPPTSSTGLLSPTQSGHPLSFRPPPTSSTGLLSLHRPHKASV